MSTSESEVIAKRIAGLCPADQLKLAAELLEQAAERGGDAQLVGIAHSVVDRVARELGAALALYGLRGEP